MSGMSTGENTMKVSELTQETFSIKETTAAGAIASVANPTTAKSKPKKKVKVKSVNALDSNANLFGGGTVKR
jgi:hypothetical protein